MSFPTRADYAVIKYGDGATPEVFTVFCGVQDVTINETSNTSDITNYDCAKPGAPGVIERRVNSNQWDVTGSGVLDQGQAVATRGLLGRKRNFQMDLIADNGTDAGQLLGTYAGSGILTARNSTMSKTGEPSSEITIAGNGQLTYTPATGA